MPKIDYAAIKVRHGSSYPGDLKNITNGCDRKQISDHVKLVQFGVNYTRLGPGAATSLRHWHENEDEFVIIFQGEVVLVTTLVRQHYGREKVPDSEQENLMATNL